MDSCVNLQGVTRTQIPDWLQVMRRSSSWLAENAPANQQLGPQHTSRHSEGWVRWVHFCCSLCSWLVSTKYLFILDQLDFCKPFIEGLHPISDIWTTFVRYVMVQPNGTIYKGKSPYNRKITKKVHISEVHISRIGCTSFCSLTLWVGLGVIRGLIL